VPVDADGHHQGGRGRGVDGDDVDEHAPVLLVRHRHPEDPEHQHRQDTGDPDLRQHARRPRALRLERALHERDGVGLADHRRTLPR
jgi:hypothetical protein